MMDIRKNSFYKLAVVAFLGMASSAFAQTTPDYTGKVGVNTEKPNATLDVVAKVANGSKIEGLKTPQLTGDALKEMTKLLTADNNGLVVFVTSAVATPDASTSAVTLPGHYRFNFTKVDTGLTGAGGDPILYGAKSWVRMEPTGLEFVVENGKGGRRLVGANADKYGNIGRMAVDLSHQTGTDGGATGDVSFATGQNTKATGTRSFTGGENTTASGTNSVAFGGYTEATGTRSCWWTEYYSQW